MSTDCSLAVSVLCSSSFPWLLGMIEDRGMHEKDEEEAEEEREEERQNNPTLRIAPEEGYTGMYGERAVRSAAGRREGRRAVRRAGGRAGRRAEKMERKGVGWEGVEREESHAAPARRKEIMRTRDLGSRYYFLRKFLQRNIFTLVLRSLSGNVKNILLSL